ncbi:MAG TPA: hypothetical protein VF995_10555 [Actinomycetota bacterium]
MTPAAKSKVFGVLAALVVLAGIAGRASPGFAVGKVTGVVSRTVRHALAAGSRPTPAIQVPAGRAIGASPYALSDIPASYLALYVKAAPTCPALTWQMLAGIGKVETNHGRSTLPGVHTGINSAGCCAGPMQFNINNGPPSTWQSFGRGGNVYDPADAIPAAARKLCANGLALPPPAADPCRTVMGSSSVHAAIMRYNNACWYVHEVLTFAARYTSAALPPASTDPFVLALVHNPNISTTRSRGCDPGPDLASGKLDLRVQSILAVLAQRWRLRVSCVKTGHSYDVAGTTRVSNHTVWRAVDIDAINGQAVTHASAASRALVLFLDRLQGPLRPTEVGSPFAVGHRPYFTDEGHQEHVHIGYGAL